MNKVIAISSHIKSIFGSCMIHTTDINTLIWDDGENIDIVVYPKGTIFLKCGRLPVERFDSLQDAIDSIYKNKSKMGK